MRAARQPPCTEPVRGRDPKRRRLPTLRSSGIRFVEGEAPARPSPPFDLQRPPSGNALCRQGSPGRHPSGQEPARAGGNSWSRGSPAACRHSTGLPDHAKAHHGSPSSRRSERSSYLLSPGMEAPQRKRRFARIVRCRSGTGPEYEQSAWRKARRAGGRGQYRQPPNTRRCVQITCRPNPLRACRSADESLAQSGERPRSRNLGCRYLTLEAVHKLI